MTSRRKNKKSTDDVSDGLLHKKRRSNEASTSADPENVDVFGDEIDQNKINHPALAGVSLTDSPLGITLKKKKSFLVNPQLINEEGFEANDDEAELREESIKKAQEKEKLDPKKGDALKGFNFSNLSCLSAAELKEHVMQCVKLSTENKITTKNAFALQLIDCMAYMMKKDNSDFSTMACTLDASAKIYSLRVDSVCNDINKLIDVFLSMQHKPSKKNTGGNVNNDDDNDDAEEESGKKTYRHRRPKKNPVLVSEESLTAKIPDKNPLRKFLKLEVFQANTGAFNLKCVWDPYKKLTSLAKDVPFLYNYEDESENVGEVDVLDFFSEEEIEGPSMKDGSLTNIGLENFFNNTETVEKVASSRLETEPENIVSVEECVESQSDEDWDLHGETPADDESFHEEPVAESESQINCVTDVIKQMEVDHNDLQNGEIITRRTEKLQAIFDNGTNASEYSYLEQSYSPVWTGPDYWKKSYKGRLVGHAKKGGKKKRGPSVLMFDNCNVNEFKKGVSQKLSKRTMLNWKEEKVTVPEDLNIDPNIFLQLFFRSKDKSYIHKLGKGAMYMLTNAPCTPNTTVYSEDLMAITEDPKTSSFENENDDDDNDGGMASPCHPGNDSFEELTGHQDELNTNEGIGESSKVLNRDLLEGSNLIPAPRLVSIQEIKYATKPNKVNMKELKTSLFDMLVFEHQNKENKLPDDENTACKFSELYQNLCATLPASDEEKMISPSMAFLALLHLANENNFQLRYLEGNTDFHVLPDSDLLVQS